MKRGTHIFTSHQIPVHEKVWLFMDILQRHMGCLCSTAILFFTLSCRIVPDISSQKSSKIDWIVCETLEHDDVRHAVYFILVATAIAPGGFVCSDAYELITRAVHSLSLTLQSGEHEEDLTGYALELQYVYNRLRSGWGQYVNPVILEDFQIQYEAFRKKHTHLTSQIVAGLDHSPVLSLDMALKTSNPFQSILLARTCIEKQSMGEDSPNIVQHWRDEFFFPVQKLWDKNTKRYVQRDCIMDDFSFNCMAFFIYYSFYNLGNSALCPYHGNDVDKLVRFRDSDSGLRASICPDDSFQAATEESANEAGRKIQVNWRETNYYRAFE